MQQIQFIQKQIVEMRHWQQFLRKILLYVHTITINFSEYEHSWPCRSLLVLLVA